MTSIYIAGASAEIERCESFRDACKALGYTIAFDWMACVRGAGAANAGLTDDVRREAKRHAYTGASTCDVFVLLLPGKAWGEQRHTIGAWCELGAAETSASRHAEWHGIDRAILIVGDNPERTVMTVDLPHVATDADALEWLRERMGRHA